MKSSKATLIISAALSATMAMADDQTLIVFDGSGSMWGQLDGISKISIAKDAVMTISEQFRPEQAVGLMAYGHRHKGDCSDIELMLPPTTGQIEALKTKVNSIQPKGKTPLSAAVKAAAEHLKYTENKAEVVLITDGVETCQLDPCTVATELEQLGVDFTAHVIGFDLSADQGKQVACVADITGGQFIPASDAASLNQALETVIVDTDDVPEEPVELPTASLNTGETPPVIGAGFTVQWTGPDGERDYIDVVPERHENTHSELSYAWTNQGKPSQLRAPGEPGTYLVRYIWQGPKTRHVLAETKLTVVDSDVSLTAPAQVDAGVLFEVSWKGPNRPGDYVDLVKSGEARTYGEISYFYTKVGQTGGLLAPATAGNYDIRYVMEAPDGRKVLHRVPFTVQAAKVTLAAQPEAELATSIDVFWTGPMNNGSYVDLVKSGDQRTYGELSYFYLKDAPDNGQLLTPVEPDDYDIRYVMEGGDGRQIMARQPIRVTAVPASLTAPATIAPGDVITVEWRGPNRKGDYVDLVKQGDKRTYGELSYFYTNDNPNQGQLKAPSTPGVYTIRYMIQGKKRAVLTTQDITVE